MNNKWTPETNGEELKLLLSNLGVDDKSKSKLVEETGDLLSMCGDPKEKDNSSVGLAFGYVQSGKTMSFTALAAMARDNDYQIVIVIAGISTNLVNQSTDRLKKDLQLGNRTWYNQKWTTVIKNPPGISERDTMQTILSEWKHPTFLEEDRRSILITVMKNRNHLSNLIQIFDTLNLENVPVLIIDDEGDQASLNTLENRNAREGITREELDAERHYSTIHRQIEQLRNLCSHHTLVQYTATPQANLFINIMNRLSPDFIKLLTPGAAYTGAERYFIQEPELVRSIPSRDIPTNDNIVPEVPDSLIYALQLYFIGVCLGRLRRSKPDYRSMMIHPSRLQYDQNWFYMWVNSIKERFSLTLQQSDSFVEKQDLVNQFKSAYNDIRQTEVNMPSFNELIGNQMSTDRLMHSIHSTRILLVNSSRGQTPSIDWKNNYSHILVGGQSMSRGFTVEGLTVTYMPRNIGTGNVDTIQQRARFFGYKSGYIGLCRVYLDSDTILAYRDYVEHEKNLRNTLKSHSDSGRHLNMWERTVILNDAYRLARNNIFSNRFLRRNFSETWITVNYPYSSTRIVQHNHQVINRFIESHKFHDFKISSSVTNEQTHSITNIKLSHALTDLLIPYYTSDPDDSDRMTTLSALTQNYIDTDHDANAAVYLMSKNNIRSRSVNETGQITNYFQGRNVNTEYPGDREIKSDDGLTIQIHRLNLSGGPISDNDNDSDDVYGLAIYLPGSIGKTMISQGEDI